MSASGSPDWPTRGFARHLPEPSGERDGASEKRDKIAGFPNENAA